MSRLGSGHSQHYRPLCGEGCGSVGRVLLVHQEECAHVQSHRHLNLPADHLLLRYPFVVHNQTLFVDVYVYFFTFVPCIYIPHYDCTTCCLQITLQVCLTTSWNTIRCTDHNDNSQVLMSSWHVIHTKIHYIQSERSCICSQDKVARYMITRTMCLSDQKIMLSGWFLRHRCEHMCRMISITMLMSQAISCCWANFFQPSTIVLTAHSDSFLTVHACWMMFCSHTWIKQKKVSSLLICCGWVLIRALSLYKYQKYWGCQYKSVCKLHNHMYRAWCHSTKQTRCEDLSSWDQACSSISSSNAAGSSAVAALQAISKSRHCLGLHVTPQLLLKGTMYAQAPQHQYCHLGWALYTLLGPACI